MNIGVRKWGTLIILSIIWGSSYILIKKGLTGLTPIQLGSLRMIITAIIIAPFGISKLNQIPRNKIKWVAFSAFIGTFFPNYLFAFAETEISSAVAVFVNISLFRILVRALLPNSKNKIARPPCSSQGRQRFFKFQILKVGDLKNVTNIEFNRKFSVKNSVSGP